MSRPRLIDRDTPTWKRLYLYPYQIFSSLGLAVTLLVSLAATLALGTFVEAAYGTQAAQFFVYRAWWFNLLMALLATNIFCAAAVRFPWKRHQTGFVVTHIGLLTLIFSSLISRLYGIDAQIPVFEYDSSNWAVDDDFLFELAIRDESGAATPAPVALRFFGMNWVGILAAVVTLLVIVGGIAAAAIHALRRGDFRYLFGAVGLSGLTLLAMAVWISMHYSYSKQELPLAKSPGTRVERVNFSPGPISWEDYGQFTPGGEKATLGRLFYAPPVWVSMRSRAGQTLYDRDGIKLEVLDYLADADEIVVPRLELQVTAPAAPRVDERGRTVAAPVAWNAVELSPVVSPNESQFPVGLPIKESVGGGAFVFGLAANEAEERSFLETLPQGELGERGQVAVLVGGKTYRVSIDERFGGDKFELGDGWNARVAAYWQASRLTPTTLEAWRGGEPLEAHEDAAATGPDSPTVKLELFAPKNAGTDPTATLTLFAVTPNFNLQAHEREIYGAYWFDHSKLDAQQRMKLAVSRIEILQGHRESESEPWRLLYRYWNGGKIVASGELPASGSKETALDAFVMPIATLKMFVSRYRGSDRAETTMIGRPFDREAVTASTVPAAKVRLTVDRESEEFWITAYLGFPDEEPNHPSQSKFLASGERLVSLKMPIDMYDVGFRVYLQEFERRLDPGTSQPSHYSSTVTFLDRDVDRGVFSAPADGGEAEFRKLPDAKSVSDIEVASDGSLIWCEQATGRIARIDATTGEVETLLDDPTRAPEFVALGADAEDLFWTENRPGAEGVRGAVHATTLGDLRQARDDGSVLVPKKVYEQSGPLGDLAFLDDAVYFVNPAAEAIGKAPLAGEADPIWLFPVAGPRDVAIDDESDEIYWIESADASIRRRAVAGGDKSMVLASDNERVPVALAIDQANGRLVWTEEDRSPRRLVEAESRRWTPLQSSVRSLPLESAGLLSLDAEDREPTMIAGPVDQPGQIAVAPSKPGEVYWIQRPSMMQDAWVTMNAPVEMSDPVHGRTFRVFQESFSGPFTPGEREFETRVPADADRRELFRSVLTVNHDPGRGIRNLGCLLVVLGIFLMFYMRAYFFKPKTKAAAVTEGAARSESKRSLPRDTREPANV